VSSSALWTFAAAVTPLLITHQLNLIGYADKLVRIHRELKQNDDTNSMFITSCQMSIRAPTTVSASQVP